MKLIIVALALVTIAVALEVPKILRSDYDQKPEGGYAYSFESEDGIRRDETAELKVVVDEENNPHPVLAVKGSYSYPKEDGTIETINYNADETGFHPEGDSIPKPSRR